LNDFQAGAESLIASNYTNSEKLAIYGRANGGMVVGAAITQRPDLFKVALPASGVLDMLRYHTYTVGSDWVSDYGRSDDPIAFDYLLAYSPLHHIEAGQYPAVLATTTDYDQRIMPAHSFKFISELQTNQKGDNPVLIRVEKNLENTTSTKIIEAVDILSFTFYNLNENINY
jgi:prolyl oligopeptidase